MVKKIKLIVMTFLLGTIILSTGCMPKPTGKETQSKNTNEGSYKIIYNFSKMDSVNVTKDVPYKSDNDKLKLDVYYPLEEKDVSKTPTVILIHGSAPDNNLKNSIVYQTWGKKVAVSGAAAVTFNWRPTVSNRDVSDLIKYIRENAATLKLNADNISVIAFSAGVNDGLKEAMKVNTGFIKSVVAYYGYIDNSILTMNTNVKLPSFFIAMAEQDTNYRPDMNDDFISKAEKAGCNVIKIVHSTSGHGFDAFDAGNHETKVIIDKTLKFIQDNSNL